MLAINLAAVKPSQATESILNVQHIFGSKNLWNINNKNTKYPKKSQKLWKFVFNKMCTIFGSIPTLNDWTRVSFPQKHVSRQTHLTKERPWMSWEWSAQQQENGWSRVASHVVSPQSVRTSHKISKHWCQNGLSRKAKIPNNGVHKNWDHTVGTYILQEPAGSIWDSTAGTKVLKELAGSTFIFAEYIEDTSCSHAKPVCMCLY
jgi:hypothetical protein